MRYSTASIRRARGSVKLSRRELERVLACVAAVLWTVCILLVIAELTIGPG